MRKLFFILLLLIPIFISGCCNSQLKFSFVNTSHLDNLYEEVELSGKTVGIIHIYSDYPDYNWVGDSDEGIACIDDVARAAVFYLNNYRTSNNEASLEKAGKLIEIVLAMQSENGFYYNFIFDDLTINKTHKNSLPQGNWWSWRAMWSLMEAYNVYIDTETDFAERIFNSVQTAVSAIKENLPVEQEMEVYDGFNVPSWLPWGSAADQAGVLLQSLVPYYEITKDEIILDYIHALQEGISIMQIEDDKFPYNGVLKSWRNMWHAYGNIQAYSLLLSSQLSDNKLTESALKEIDNFYSALMGKNYLSNFYLQLNDKQIEIAEHNQFAQIAYNIRPMVYACLEAYKITSDTSYAVKAADIASWFFGNNPANAQMYFPGSGICYDGINSEDEVNMNSGAESTIEALLTLQAIESNPIAKEKLLNFFNQHIR